MVFYLEQVEGKLNEAAKALHEAVRSGNQAAAEAIYTKYVGEFPEHAGTCWWTFNAAAAVRRNHGVFTEAAERFDAMWGEGSHVWNSEDFHKFMAKMAAEKVGGEWRVCWEY